LPRLSHLFYTFSKFLSICKIFPLIPCIRLVRFKKLSCLNSFWQIIFLQKVASSFMLLGLNQFWDLQLLNLLSSELHMHRKEVCRYHLIFRYYDEQQIFSKLTRTLSSLQDSNKAWQHKQLLQLPCIDISNTRVQFFLQSLWFDPKANAAKSRQK
jgi:hypothetical protein